MSAVYLHNSYNTCFLLRMQLHVSSDEPYDMTMNIYALCLQMHASMFTYCLDNRMAACVRRNHTP
jgi:hypothetical protein